MKKFIGNVNGREYYNECDFKKAAAEAIANGDEQLCISSYYKEIGEVKTRDDSFEPDWCEKLTFDDIKPKDTLTSGYSPNEKLLYELKNISHHNAVTLKKEIELYIDKCNKDYWNSKNKILKYNSEIDKLQNEVKEHESILNKIHDEKHYYNNILDCLNEKYFNYSEDSQDTPCDNEDCKCGDCKCEKGKITCDNKISSTTEEKEYTDEEIKEDPIGYLIDLFSGFGAWLDETGFWDSDLKKD